MSLVETIVAVAVLAVGVLSLARLFTVSASALERAQRSSIAAVLASQKLEELRQAAVDSAPLAADGIDRVDARGVAHATSPSGSAAGYTREWSVRELAADPDRLRLVRVRVAPDAGGARDASPTRRRSGDVTVMTILTRQDP